MTERTKYRVGWIVTVLACLPLIMSASMKFVGGPQVTDSFVKDFGYPIGTLVVLGVVELTCTLLYLFPATSVFGAILLTGYLGGAVATHVRIGDVFLPPLVVGILAWIGLYLREPRLRPLVPLRNNT